jgi:protein-tyrosine phosphatase
MASAEQNSEAGKQQSIAVTRRNHQLVNFRDVAGCRLFNGRVIPPGILYRGDALYPGGAVPDDVPVWPPASVIDLRSDGEADGEYVWPEGTLLYKMPVMPEADVIGTAAAPNRVVPLPPNLFLLYSYMLVIVSQELPTLLSIAIESRGPIFVHCTAGKDRTGVAIAVLLLIGGADPADVINDYVSSEANMEPLIRRLEGLGRSLPTDMDITSPMLRAPAAAVSIIVDTLTSWPGGPTGWALANGATRKDIQRWRDRLNGGNQSTGLSESSER